MSFLSAALLSKAIDDHIEWMSAWLRRAFYDRKNKGGDSASPEPPDSFARWQVEALKNEKDMPSFKKLIGLHDELHRLARLAILRTPDGSSLSVADFDAVSTRYEDLLAALRQMERSENAGAENRDPLTGLRSRIGLRNDLERELNRFLRTRKPFCVAMMDVDYLKKINDPHGRENGDKILAAVSNYVVCGVRPFDSVWRWGGEQLMICLKEVDKLPARHVLERVRSGLQKLPIKLFDGREAYVTASFGVVSVNETSTVEDLLANADKALHAAKERGRKRIEGL